MGQTTVYVYYESDTLKIVENILSFRTVSIIGNLLLGD